MNYYDVDIAFQRYINEHQSLSRSISSSFSDEQNRPKRRKTNQSRKWRGKNANSYSRNNTQGHIFKELPTPPRRNAGGQYERSPSAGRDKPFYQAAPPRQPQQTFFELDDMPNFVEPQHYNVLWNWENYILDCKSWHDKHKLAYYRSRCLALEFKNQMLLDQIKSLIEENCVFAVERGKVPTMRVPEIPSQSGQQRDRFQPNNSQTDQKKQGKKHEKASNGTDSELEFEVSEEMMAFLEKSIRHKLDLRRKRNREKLPEKTVKKIDVESKKQGSKGPVGQKRKEELIQLYGDQSSFIHELETAFQVKFNRNVSTFKPGVWMAVPLNLQHVSCP